MTGATRGRLAKGVLLVGSIVFVLAATDVALRLVGYSPAITQDWLLSHDGQWRLPNEDLILIPYNFLQPGFYDTDPSRPTVVTLGDSFTEGVPVGPEDRYPRVLQEMLERQGHSVNMLNLGIAATGPDQQLRLVKRYLLPRLTPDIVVWTFYSNDIMDNFSKAVYAIEDDKLVPLNGADHWLYKRQVLYRRIPLPLSIKKDSPLIRIGFRAMQTVAYKRIWQGSEEERVRRSTAKIRLAIAEMERLAEANDFTVYYVLIAPEASYLAETDPAAWDEHLTVEYDKQLRSLLSERSRFIDARFAERAPAELFADESRDRNPLGRRHLNETGYRLLAEVVFASLLEDQVGPLK